MKKILFTICMTLLAAGVLAGIYLLTKSAVAAVLGLMILWIIAKISPLYRVVDAVTDSFRQPQKHKIKEKK